MYNFAPCLYDPSIPCTARQQVAPVATTTQPLTDPIRLEEVDVTYPRIFGQINPAVQYRINRAIRQQARKYMPEPTSYMDIVYANSSYTQTLRKNNIFSLRFESGYFQNHAAHPISFLSSITFNARTGQIYSLADLFDPQSNYKQRLTRIIQQQIIAKQIPLLVPFKGITGNEDFYLTNDGLVIYYQIYEYTPYVYGILQFTIPYSEIRDIISKSGPLPQVI